MVDIHCHILPGIDDGAESLEIAQAMGEMAIADGITHVIGTPHASPNYRFSPRLVRERRDELQAIFAERLVLATGCDFHLSFENLQDIKHDSARYALNQKNYLLVEFADYSIPPSLDQSLHELQLAGLRPIVTHPERNPLIRAQPERLYKWLAKAATCRSPRNLCGENSENPRRRWRNNGYVRELSTSLPATHTTSLRGRRSLKETFDQVASAHGEELARALLVDNPLAAFEGRPLPYVPELPEDLVANNPEPQGPRRRKRFWFF